MNDIQNRQDIELLVDEFYKRVVPDDLIGFIFTEIVALDWDLHIPIMCDFWESMLLGAMKYKGNAMVKHIELNQQEPLKAEYFDRWLSLWVSTVHANFKGAKADEAMQRATQIGELMKYKVQQYSL